MQAWEIVVLIAGVAFVALSVYLIIAIKKLTQTLTDLDKMLKENSPKVQSIVSNVDEITSSAKNAVGKIDTVATNVGSLAASAGNMVRNNITTIKWATQIIGLAIGLFTIVKNRAAARKSSKEEQA